MEARRYAPLTPSGTQRVVQRVPADLRLLDLSEDGRVLVNRVNFRSGINCLAPGQTAERELSWFDASGSGRHELGWRNDSDYGVGEGRRN